MEVSGQLHAPFTLPLWRNPPPPAHGIRGGGGPTAGRGGVENKAICFSCRESNPDLSIVQPVP
jgi:hypothetical protein